jgi:thiamine-phosphate pyrophosphorylase
MHAPALRGYYAILDLTAPRPAGALDLGGLAAQADALLSAGPCALQLRAKGFEAAAIFAAARFLLPQCRARGVPFCVNDRVDLALAVGADMVHVGQDDLPLAEVRRLLVDRPRGLLDTPLRVGVSTHDPAQARAAIAGGADYLGFGPVFPTRTKQDPDPVVGLAALAAVARTSPIPVVAIGGITRANIIDVVAAGAHAAAVISDISRAPEPAAAARAVAAAFLPEPPPTTPVPDAHA